MSIMDVLKKSFIENYSTAELMTTQIAVTLFVTLLLGIYIYFCYRVKTRNIFYSKEFGISLIVLAIITAGIVLTIQQSIIVSLGMVGALSIVRFRTAIKNPMDLIFLFWSIGVGIICGAGITEVAILMSLSVTGVMFFLELLPDVRTPIVLTVGYKYKTETDDAVFEAIKKYSNRSEMKARTIVDGKADIVVELRAKDQRSLTREISGVSGVESVSIMSYDGDAIF